MADKKLNIGLIGYGFMGRALSNAYPKVNRFLDLAYEPVLKAAFARKKDKLKAFADNWGRDGRRAQLRSHLFVRCSFRFLGRPTGSGRNRRPGTASNRLLQRIRFTSTSTRRRRKKSPRFRC